MKEIEVKFEIQDSQAIKAKIENFGAKYQGRYSQLDHWMDTKDGQLKKKGWGLRLRRENGRTTLTLKGRLVEDQKFREEEEVEVEVKGYKKVEEILENLGYKDDFILRKERRKWRKGNLEIVLDEVENLGTFLELEGSKEEMVEAIENLGLKEAKRITKHYGEIYKDYQ